IDVATNSRYDYVGGLGRPLGRGRRPHIQVILGWGDIAKRERAVWVHFGGLPARGHHEVLAANFERHTHILANERQTLRIEHSPRDLPHLAGEQPDIDRGDFLTCAHPHALSLSRTRTGWKKRRDKSQ